MPTIEIDNKTIHYLEMNQGAPQTIVMVHGMFTNLSVFYFKIAPELAKKYHIVLYDLRSHGLSQRVDSGYDLQSMNSDLMALMDALNLTKVHLVGYSFGGLLSLYTATHFSERVDKMVIIEAPDPSHSNTHELLAKYGKEFMDHYLENYSKTTNLVPSKRQLAKNRDLFDFLFFKSSLKDDLTADRHFFEETPFESITQETLLLFANGSDCIPTGELLNKKLPHSSLYFGDGDHSIPVQNPEWIIEKLNSFF